MLTDTLSANGDLVALVDRLTRENLELAGRVGFYQAKLQDAEAKIALLEAPSRRRLKSRSPRRPIPPSGDRNGQDSGAQQPSGNGKRP